MKLINVGVIASSIYKASSGATTPQLKMVFNSTGNSLNFFVQGSSNFTMTVEWGDGNKTDYVSSSSYQPTHSYATNGNYTASTTFNNPELINNLDVSTNYGNNRLKNILGLEEFSGLTYLNLAGNLITNFDTTISTLPDSIQVLDLSYNSITAFTPTNLPQGLTDLYLNNNLLTGFTPAISFPLDFKTLYLNDNLITTYNPSIPIQSLQALNLSYNQISNFAPTNQLSAGLEILDLSYNQISTFNPPVPFPNAMNGLYLNNNNFISDGISDVLYYLSGVTNWNSPGNITLFNQAAGGVLLRYGNGYNGYLSLTASGWTIDVQIASGATYYVSSSYTGATQNGALNTPFTGTSTINSRLYNGLINPGDLILFKRNDNFVSTRTDQAFMIWNTTNNYAGTAKSGTLNYPIIIGAYGTGTTKPNFQGTYSWGLFTLLNVQHYRFEDFSVNDTVFNVNDRLSDAPIKHAFVMGEWGFGVGGQKTGLAGTGLTSNCVIRNCDFSNIGGAVVIAGNNNLIENCTFTNLKANYNVINPDTAFGSNSVTLTGNYNIVRNCYAAHNWYASRAFGYDGGFIEGVDSCSYNIFSGNTIIDDSGLFEWGSFSTGATQVCINNTFAYNKVINMGGLSYFHLGGDTGKASGNTLNFYNNVAVENSQSRFSGPNYGLGMSSYTEVWSGFSADTGAAYWLGTSATGSTTPSVFVLKNNLFFMYNKQSLVATGIYNVSGRTTHENNIYIMSTGITGSSLGFITGATEWSANTLYSIITDNSSIDPTQWDFRPTSSSKAKDFGQNLGYTRDFGGNLILNPPNAGIYETVT